MPATLIPVVDFAVYYDSSSTLESRHAAAISLAQACSTLGFVAIRNHGIPKPLLEQAFVWSRKLFALSHEDKMKAPHPAAAMPHRGYSAPGLEKVYSRDEGNECETGRPDKPSLREIHDYKESYEIGSDDDPDQPNIWLPDVILPGFRPFMTRFYFACNELGNVILNAMTEGMRLEGKEQDIILGLNSQHCNQLRLLHYPIIEPERLKAERLTRMPAHTDWGSFTILFQDGTGGLELMSPKSGEWIAAYPTEEICILNIGDFFERITNGHFKSALHRVRFSQSETNDLIPERYSIPYFVAPTGATVGRCLDTFVTKDMPAKYDPLTFAEYAAWRGKHSYEACKNPHVVAAFEKDDVAKFVEHDKELQGFESYIVEQWACSRVNPALAITTFTGQTQHKVFVSVFEIPEEEQTWSSTIRSYVAFVVKNHAKRHETHDGIIFATNLSTFPSTFSILPVSTGNVRKQESLFLLNENLKRMGCLGRAGISLSDPPETAFLRFRNTYRISERISAFEAVIELVKMCQATLSIFGNYSPQYCDGLLCDLTVSSVDEWWRETGSQFYNIEPSDGVLGPTTVAGLLGLFLGARNRLQGFGVSVPKDAFDLDSLKRGISQFQKAQGLTRNCKLDRATMQRLHKVTAKAANSEGWAVQRAVKSTVAELGKGGEMVMGMVGAKDRAGIADVESTDIEIFARRMYGKSCKWLWRGKIPKSTVRNVIHANLGEIPSSVKLSKGNTIESSSSGEEELSRTSIGEDNFHRNDILNSTTFLPPGRESHPKKTVLGSFGGRMSEAKTGLGRIRGAIGSSSKDNRNRNTDDELRARGSMKEPQSRQLSLHGQGREIEPRAINDDQGLLAESSTEAIEDTLQHKKTVSSLKPKPLSATDQGSLKPSKHVKAQREENIEALLKQHTVGIKLSENEIAECIPVDSRHGIGVLKRSRSDVSQHSMKSPLPLTGIDLEFLAKLKSTQLGTQTRTATLLTKQDEMASCNTLDSQILRISNLNELLASASRLLENCVKPADAGVKRTAHLKSHAKKTEELLHDMAEKIQSRINLDLKSSDEVVLEIDELLSERLHEIEALGSKLEYELGVLDSKIEDVEDGISDLDRQVAELESRVRLLGATSRDHSWQQWVEVLIRRLGIM